jgi:acyl carrier protein
MNTTESVFDVIRELILELKDDGVENITLESTIEALDLDSLDFVEMQVVVRKKLGVAMDPKAFASRNISTLQALCDYILELTQAAHAPA